MLLNSNDEPMYTNCASLFHHVAMAIATSIPQSSPCVQWSNFTMCKSGWCVGSAYLRIKLIRNELVVTNDFQVD
jgi:hypothetical protein